MWWILGWILVIEFLSILLISIYIYFLLAVWFFFRTISCVHFIWQLFLYNSGCCTFHDSFCNLCITICVSKILIMHLIKVTCSSICLKDIPSTVLLFSDMSVHCLRILWWEEFCGHPSPFCADSNSRFTIFIFDLLLISLISCSVCISFVLDNIFWRKSFFHLFCKFYKKSVFCLSSYKHGILSHTAGLMWVSYVWIFVFRSGLYRSLES